MLDGRNSVGGPHEEEAGAGDHTSDGVARADPGRANISGGRVGDGFRRLISN
jgi:hypothetical protein